MGRLEESRADFDTVLGMDPFYAEYYLDRGNLLRRLGDDHGAIEDYQHAMSLSAPFPELYYNRGDALASIGDTDGALRDFSYVLELEPGDLNARINRAALRLETGDPRGAAQDVADGIARDPNNAHLLGIAGLFAMEEGATSRARAFFARALVADPTMHAAQVNGAVAAYADEDFMAAVDLLTAALADTDPDDPTLLFNRGYAYQGAGLWDMAVADYTSALAHPGADRGALLYQRAACLAEQRQDSYARADLEQLLRLGLTPYADDARRLLVGLPQ